MKCEQCNHEFQAQEQDLDACPHCGEPVLDDSTQDSIKRFKWYFIGIVVFCAVMIIYLPR